MTTALSIDRYTSGMERNRLDTMRVFGGLTINRRGQAERRKSASQRPIPIYGQRKLNPNGTRCVRVVDDLSAVSRNASRFASDNKYKVRRYMMFFFTRQALHGLRVLASNAAASGALFVAVTALAAPFTPGNIVVQRVGDGTAALTSAATASFLDEYTPAGALVQSIALPVAVNGANKRVTASGTATTDSLLNRSADGKYLLATGYDAAVGTASVTGTASTATNRVVARVGVDTSIDSTTALTDAATGTNFRAAASADGNAFWVTGGSPGSVRYATLGGTTSAQLVATPTNYRGVAIVDGQLYVSSGTGSFRMASVGTGAPTTTAQTIAQLPGIPITNLFNQFFFAQLNPSSTSADTLYVADETASTGGIIKYSRVSGSWVSNGVIVGTAYRGLTGVVSGTSVTLYATRNGTELVSISDASGHNGALSGSATLLATAGTNTTIRGVAMAPQVAVTVTPSIVAGSGTISPDTAQPKFYGQTATFTVTPAFGFSASVAGSCGGNLSGTTYTTNTLTASCTVEVTFTSIPSFTITPSVVGNGSISPDTLQTVLSGQTRQFAIAPGSGQSFAVGGTCGGTLSGNTYTTSPVTANCSVVATFTQITYTITPSAGANGTINPDTLQTVNAQSTKVFTVMPEGGYSATVGGSCGGSLSGTTYTTNPVTASCTVEATFNPLPTFTVTPVVTSNGTLSPPTAQTVYQNGTVTFTPTPASGYSVVISGCGGKMSGATFTTAPVTANCTVTASFAKKNILFVGNSYTFARVDPAMTYNAANVNDLTAAFNAQYPNGTNSWPWNGATCTGVPFNDGCFEPHPWGGVPGIFKALTVQAGLDYNVSFSTRNAATLRGHFLNTSNTIWDLRGNIASQKWDIVTVQGQSDEPLPANKSKNGNPASFKTYASQIAKYVRQGNGQSTDLVTTEQAIYAAEGFGTSTSTTPRTIPPNFNANPGAKVYVMQNWSRPDMVEAHKCTVADYTSNDGAPLLDPTCAAGANGSNGDNNIFYTSQPTTALNLNDITTDMNAALSSLLSGSGQFSGVVPSGNAFQKAVNAGVVKNSNFYNASGTYDESGPMNLWWLDRTHGSKYGSYLSALVHFARLSGQDPTQFGGSDAVAAGLGISSANAVTLQQMAKAAVVPGAPTSATAIAGDALVTVSFTPPANLGGPDITGYTATCGSQSVTGTASPLVVTGLINGAPVACTLVATNSVGNSLPSTATGSVTPKAVTATGVTANINPTAVGQTVVFTATVTTSASGLTGTVSFLDGASPVCAAAPLSGTQSQCVTDALPAGARSITAAYSGDGQNLASTSAILTQTVNASGSLVLTVVKAGSGAGSVQSSPPGINCGTDCAETYDAAIPVTLAATPNAGFIFTGWTGACTGRSTCSLSLSSSALVTATFAPASTPLNLDIDGTGAYRGDSDGVILVRYLFGIRGTALTADTLATADPALIAQRLDDIRPLLDIDGDGRVDAMTDGMLAMRYLLGLRGAALIGYAISPTATRTLSGDIESYLQGITPTLP
jgi:Bacterial Ig-like domain (group 3)/Divergent InlB B-repeat domain